MKHHQASLTDDIRKHFDHYLTNEKAYFTRPEYDQETLNMMYAAVTNFYTVISTTLFNLKKSLLEYQAGLV